ncbi:MAG: class I SAM-dependent rRNA methyltransferase [Saprospiraceae bacterium]
MIRAYCLESLILYKILINMKQVFLREDRAHSLNRKHPWLFSGALWKLEDGLEDGDLVHVMDHEKCILATGHFHHGSIAVRVLAFEEQDISLSFYQEKIRQCLNLRSALNLPNAETNCFRLVHGEGDALPGLIIDVYGKMAVVQCHSIGMYRQVDLICEALSAVCEDIIDCIYIKSRESLPLKFAAEIQNGFWKNEGETGEVFEHGHRILVNPGTGQKTGFFIDQRENRFLLGTLSHGKRVLNTYCYTGGFSIYALAAGAKMVTSVDVSQTAMDLLEKQLEINTFPMDRHQSVTADVVKFLSNTDEEYDLIIVDPPAFAKTLDKRHNAINGYKRLNQLAIARVAKGDGYTCEVSNVRHAYFDLIELAFIEYNIPIMCIQVKGTNAAGVPLTPAMAQNLTATAFDKARYSVLDRVQDGTVTNPAQAQTAFKDYVIAELLSITGNKTTSSISYGACQGNVPIAPYKIAPFGISNCIAPNW